MAIESRVVDARKPTDALAKEGCAAISAVCMFLPRVLILRIACSTSRLAARFRSNLKQNF